MTKKCFATHTEYQPNDKEWKCPICGADSEYFFIDTPDPEASDDCELLHKDDIVCCTNCENGWTGKEISDIFMKKMSNNSSNKKANVEELNNVSKKFTYVLYLLMENKLPCREVTNLINDSIRMTETKVKNEYLFNYAESLVSKLINH